MGYAPSRRKLLALNNLLFMYSMPLIINTFIFLFTMPEFLLVFIYHCSSLVIIVNTRTPFFIILHFRKLFAEAEEEQRKVCLLRENVYCNFKTPSIKVGEQFFMLDDMWPRNNQWESVLLGEKYFSWITKYIDICTCNNDDSIGIWHFMKKMFFSSCSLFQASGPRN